MTTEAETMPPDEFAGIPSRRRRPMILAAAAIVFAGFLAIRARHDVAYALSSPAPLVVGDARALAARSGDALPLNRYVRVSGLPDRESAVILDTSGSWKFSQFFRFLGTENRVFVRRVADPLPFEASATDQITGRLVRMNALSFDESMREHFARHVASTHFFAPAAVESALRERGATGALTLVDTTGERISVPAEDRLVVDVWRPGEIRVDMPADRFPTRAAAEDRLKKVGATLVPKTPERLRLDAGSAAGSGAGSNEIHGQGDAARHHIVVAFADTAARDAAFAALEDLDRRIGVRQAMASHEVKAGELTAGDGTLVLPGGASIPLAQVATVRTTAPVAIPADALLVLEGDRPRDHMLTIGIVGMLCVFAAVNLLALRRTA